VSQLANKFVADAREIVKTGQVVKVRVLEVDLERKRIALTMRLDAAPPARGESAGDNRFRPAARGQQPARPHVGAQPAAHGAMAAAFAKLQSGRR
jgi:uncharacterized protein